jgi:hypothetical protein
VKAMKIMSRTYVRSLALGSLWLILAGSRASTQGLDPATEARLLSALRSGTYQERRAAVEKIQLLLPAQRPSTMALALTAEVDRLYQEGDELANARAAGSNPGPADHGQYLFEVVKALSQMDTPLVVPALVKAIGTGNRPMNAIVDFGELAVARVVDVARADSTDASPALLVLARMLERPLRYPLSAQSRQAILALAHERTSGRQSGVHLVSAIELAAATGDSELIQRVRSMSQSDAPITALGVADASLVKGARNRAAMALKQRGL